MRRSQKADRYHADEPGRRTAWHSIGGDSDNAGEVIFEEALGGRGTIVTVLQEFHMGKLASAWETFVGRNPKQAAIEIFVTSRPLLKPERFRGFKGSPTETGD